MLKDADLGTLYRIGKGGIRRTSDIIYQVMKASSRLLVIKVMLWQVGIEKFGLNSGDIFGSGLDPFRDLGLDIMPF
jgi:hypothetical protein